MEKMPKNKKYYFVRNESICGTSDVEWDKCCGKYRNLCISPIPSSDSHISSESKTSLPFTSTIGRRVNRPLDSNSRVKGNVYLKSIGFISKELFESLPESKVDPDVLSYTPNVCQTHCSDGTGFTPDSHTANLQLNNSWTTSARHYKPFPRLPLEAIHYSLSRGLAPKEKSKSSVFTLIGRQNISSDKSVVKTTKENELKKSSQSLSECSGTLFGVLASPKIFNDSKNITNNQIPGIEGQNEKSIPTVSTKSAKQLTNDNNLSINDRNDVKVSESIGQIVSQKVKIPSNKEFDYVMKHNTEEDVKPLQQEIKVINDFNIYDESKQFASLKSPSIVKEVMKKIAAFPSKVADEGLHKQVSDNLSDIPTIDSMEAHCINSSDTEVMLVIQELDKSIAEGSPSTSNSPLILNKFKSNDKNENSIKLNGCRPHKPPRVINSLTTFESKHRTFIEINESQTQSQTDNLIEELYFTDESGVKSIESIKVEDNNGINAKKSNHNLSININENHFQNRKNIIDFHINYKKQINVESDDLDGAIARTSFSSVDSGTSSPNATHFIVVAIDFGTTFSGYSFAFTRDVDNSIHMMRKVEGCDPDVSNQKIPTILLLTPDGAFHSFGFAARDHYSSLEPKEAKRWFYFEKFKMHLHYNESLSLKTEIKATNGNKSMSALTVFAHSLRYFKRLAIRELSDQTAINILNEDIRWVLTVPAIWKPSAKQFMRAAAYEAGIGSGDNPQQLLIALEPEAASIYCRKLKLNQLVPLFPPRRHTLIQEKSDLTDNDLAVECQSDNSISADAMNRSHNNHSVDSVFTKGSKYIVVDVGGGTVDITCHQIQTKEGSLKELYKAMGGPNGSIGVDFNFEKLLSDIFGTEFMINFKNKRPAGYVDLMAAFEARKRSASPSQITTSNISLPFSFINFFKKSKGISVESAVKKCSELKGISYCPKLGMLRLDPSLMQQLFFPVTQQIISHIMNVLSNPPVKDVLYLFLVGGFAESQILQSHIRNAFSSHLKVIIPQSPNLAILRGATIYGLDPTIISCRRARLTYGVGVLNKFIRGKHPLQKLAIKDGIEWCADIFDKFVVCDQSIGLFETITRSYTPVNENQTCSIIHIFCSERDDIEFITDKDVFRCGTLYLDLDPIRDNHNIKREIQTQMIFGDTEIKVSALDVKTSKCVRAEIDFLNN